MRQDLNNIKGRIAAARWGEWQNSLADSWRFCFPDDNKETEDTLPPIFINAP